MKKIYLSSDGPQTSPAVYGFWRWDKASDLNSKKIEDITKYCLELGVSSFDFADNGAGEKVQELFGQLLKSKSLKRKDIVLFSKSGLRDVTSGRTVKQINDFSADYIRKSVDASLKRLKTDYLDVFLLQGYDPLIDPEELASLLTELKLKGKIKHIGVSGFNVFQHRLLASRLSQNIVTNHIELSILNTSAVDDGRLDFIREQYSKPMAWAPLAGGRILNGEDKKAIKVRSVLQELAKKYNANIEQIAVAWIYKLNALPIIGSLNKARIKNAASAYGIEITHDEWHRLYNAAR